MRVDNSTATLNQLLFSCAKVVLFTLSFASAAVAGPAVTIYSSDMYQAQQPHTTNTSAQKYASPAQQPVSSLPTSPGRNAVATFYNADGTGACSFDADYRNLMVAAVSPSEFQNSAACGSSLTIKGRLGAVTVRVVDLCADCASGQIDLSAQAFAAIENPRAGKVSVLVNPASTAVNGGIQYHFKQGSNQWWTAVQLRNHKNAIARLEARDQNGQWVQLTRTNYNYFVKDSPGLGTGPYAFRVTDVFGNTLVDEGVQHVAGQTIAGKAQFPSVYTH